MSHEFDDQPNYQPSLTRRESLRWLGLLSASAALPSLSACTSLFKGDEGHWPNLKVAPIQVPGYGKDPNLLKPVRHPWPRTLSQHQLNQVALLSDILVPREGNIPSATEVKVPEVIDEWVSAPYSNQQEDRELILNGLAWLDDESKLRFGKTFDKISSTQRLEIIDDIAYDIESTSGPFKRMSFAFSRLRELVLAAFFCTPEGTKDIGYMGNVPISGDYPGPNQAAMNHLDSLLKDLGLAPLKATI